MGIRNSEIWLFDDVSKINNWNLNCFLLRHEKKGRIKVQRERGNISSYTYKLEKVNESNEKNSLNKSGKSWSKIKNIGGVGV